MECPVGAVDRCIVFLRVRESWVWETVVRRLLSPIAGASPG